MVDFHSHILPKVDHGSESIETSLFQLAQAKKYDVDRVVSTSHFYPHIHSVEGFLSSRKNGFEMLSESLTNDLPDICLGAEVLMCEGIEKLDGLEKLAIGNSSYIMLEIPSNDFSESLIDSVDAIIRKHNLNVILAHADRYSPRIIEEFLKVGARIQLNASALSHLKVKLPVLSWLSHGYVLAIGSDIHRRDKKAYRQFHKAVKRLGPYADYITDESDKIWDKATSV